MSNDTPHKDDQTDRDLHLTDEELKASDRSLHELRERGVLQPLKRRVTTQPRGSESPPEPPTFDAP